MNAALRAHIRSPRACRNGVPKNKMIGVKGLIERTNPHWDKNDPDKLLLYTYFPRKNFIQHIFVYRIMQR